MHRFWNESLSLHGPEVVYSACKIKEEKGHNWTHREKGPRAVQGYQGGSLSFDPSSPCLSPGKVLGSLDLMG